MTKRKYIGKSLSHKKILFVIITTLSIFLVIGLSAILLWRKDSKAVVQTSTNINPTNSSTLRYAIQNLSDEVSAEIISAMQAIDPNAVKSDHPDVIFSSDTNGSTLTYFNKPIPKTDFVNDGQILQSSQLAVQFTSNNASSQWRDKIDENLSNKFHTSGETWSYLALGDIIPARDVYTHSKRQGYAYPYLKIAERSQAYDLTVTNLEATVADSQTYGEGAGMMTFTAPAKALDGLQTAGIDGVSLANNHAMNGGDKNVTRMLDELDARKIGRFGVSPTASKPFAWSAKVKNTSITHLSYNSIPGSIDATATSPGLIRLNLKPWGSLSDVEVERVKADIATTKKSTDVVIAWFHWGQEYTHQANDEQRRLAHAAIDAGADVVIGTHPHWTQGIEYYNGRIIAYSLGNFVFDQNWSEETKRSVAMELNFSGSNIVSASLLPAKIENYVQPRWLDTKETLYSTILRDIAKYSWWQ
jgi:poly-gamma-glutamate capsule biosynthesis protein CapA/YwtB (metallophosphatase superfamily)